MEFSVSILEIIIAIGVLGNFILQSYWFWSTRTVNTEPSYKQFMKEFDKSEIHDDYDYGYNSNQSVGSIPDGFISKKE